MASRNSQERPRGVALGVVRQYALNRDPPLGEGEDHALKESSSRRRFLVWQCLDVGEAAMVIDRDVDVIVATRRPRSLLPSPTGLLEAWVESLASTLRDASKSFHVEMDELTRAFPLVADNGTRRAVEASEHR